MFFQNQENRKFCINHHIADERSIVLPGSGVNITHHAYQVYPDDGVIKFLFISRLLKDKGTEEYFEMATAIKKIPPNTEFQVLGWVEGDYGSGNSEVSP